MGCRNKFGMTLLFTYLSFNTVTFTLDGALASWYILMVDFWKSESFALLISTNFCGLRSPSGNQLLCTCIIMRWPFLKVWPTSGKSYFISVILPGTNGSGCSNELRKRPLNISPRISIWYPPMVIPLGLGTGLG